MSGRHEYPDPTPVEMPLNFKRPRSLQEEIQRLIRVNMSAQADAEGFETFDEANDFDVEEDEDPFSQYEVAEMQEEPSQPKESENGEVKPVGGPVREVVSSASGKDVPAQSSADRVGESAASVAEGRGAGAVGAK